jgi:hypothetical protein
MIIKFLVLGILGVGLIRGLLFPPKDDIIAYDEKTKATITTMSEEDFDREIEEIYGND